MDSSNPSDDNPFASPKAPVPSKVLVHNANRGLAMQEVEQAKYYSGVPLPNFRGRWPDDGSVPETCKVKVHVVRDVLRPTK